MGLPIPSPGDLPNPGIEPRSPTLQADTLPSEPPGKQNKWVIHSDCTQVSNPSKPWFFPSLTQRITQEE